MLKIVLSTSSQKHEFYYFSSLFAKFLDNNFLMLVML